MGENANETSPADRDFAGSSKNRTTGAAIKGLFREAIKAITRHAESAPMPARRRRSGDKAGTFVMAARAALRRAMRLPPQAFAAARFLSDTVDWLNYWHDEADSTGDPCDYLDANRNDLSPRL